MAVVTPEALPRITDRDERLRESARFLRYAESRVIDGREARNAEIRAARAAGVPRRRIAELVGLSDDAVKAVLRERDASHG